MKPQRMVPLEEFQRLLAKLKRYRKAIRDQQKATAAWKAIALGRGLRAARSKDESGAGLYVIEDTKLRKAG